MLKFDATIRTLCFYLSFETKNDLVSEVLFLLLSSSKCLAAVGLLAAADAGQGAEILTAAGLGNGLTSLWAASRGLF